ncbi:predicted protein [Lichtheimia corymbifera JMRC:FSU:9682]|uniref:F-box domain-containing protein n=1 Tax=Lichtheimia corymbifera JMRC:FSU:9682 TaxID=1263082 RepID=A0A068S6N6_9FUNG|nr:predicted protein [Lichtheimia corymbifera JMRC:FSU:9682]
MIPRYCPLLKCAQIEIDDLEVGVSYVDTDTGSDEVVVTKLSVVADDWMGHEGFVEVDPILRQHHETLEDIKWDVKPERDFHHLDNMQYPRLKTLSLLTSAPSIVQNAPIVLEELRISLKAIHADPTILDTIPSTLKKLELELDARSEPGDANAIGQYLHRASQQSKLRGLAIDFRLPSAFENLFHIIYRFNMLERLMLSFDSTWDQGRMEGFLERLVNECPHLSFLDIDCNHAPSTHSINVLKRLGHLKELAFSIQGTDFCESFWHALRTFSQLKSIRIRHQNSVNKIQIQRLKEYRRDMNIIDADRLIISF